MLTRALGDHDLKSSGVLCAPYVSSRSFPTASALVIASDGVWDYVPEKEVAMENTAKETAKSLMQQAKKAQSRDNISLVVVYWKTRPISTLISP
jgi:serine/threonine protein phosphatase PrpC